VMKGYNGKEHIVIRKGSNDKNTKLLISYGDTFKTLYVVINQNHWWVSVNIVQTPRPDHPYWVFPGFSLVSVGEYRDGKLSKVLADIFNIPYLTHPTKPKMTKG